MPKLIYVLTVPQTAESFLIGQLKYFKSKGFEVVLICSRSETLAGFAKKEGVRCYPIEMEREISPWKDFISLCKLWLFFMKESPQIVNYGTPKAGLLGAIASFFAGVSKRVYTVHGLRFETTAGLKRKILLLTEKISCMLSHVVVGVSPSVLQVMENNQLFSGKGRVIGKGSCNGIEMSQFAYTSEVEREQERIKEKFALQKDDFVIGFVGRLVKDKGLYVLYEAFSKIKSDHSKLLLVGEMEEGDGIDEEFVKILEKDPNVLLAGCVSPVTPYYYSMDAFVLPTYREGLGMASLEAAACKLPVVTTWATGAQDSINPEETGFLTEIGNSSQVAEKIIFLEQNREKAKKMGDQGHIWVQNSFNQAKIWAELEELYLTE